jgi:hypothetical protein
VVGSQGAFTQQFVVCAREKVGVFELTAKLMGLIVPATARTTSMQQKIMAMNKAFDVIFVLP